MSANIAQVNTLDSLAPNQNQDRTTDQKFPTTQEEINLLNQTKTIRTPVIVNTYAKYLQGYNSTLYHFLIQGFQVGFRIPFQGDRQFRLSRNLPSLLGKEDILQQKIEQEIKAGRVAGPYDDPPFKNLQVSPLGLVPKKQPNEFRLIHHLSYPQGSSINDKIPHDFCTVKYQSIQDAIIALKEIGVGALIAKTDLENAYKQIPIHSDDFELLGFRVNEKFYFDKTLPFGLSYACNLFEKFSSSLHWILQNKFSVKHCVHILDDFLFLGKPGTNECHDALASFHVLAQDINLPIKSEKTVLPTTTLTFMGLEIDSLKFEIRLPEDKLIKLRQTISAFKGKRTATLRELQSLIGLLNFACAVVPPGRTFLRRIIDLTRGIQKPHHHRNLDKDARADLAAWSLFIEHFNGKAFFPSGLSFTSKTLHLFTDASNVGFGCVFGTKWFFGSFDTSWLEYHISVREFFPIILAVEIWGSLLTNTSIVLHSDNIAVVYVINKLTSKGSNLMKLMRRLMVTSLKYNISFHAEHIPGLLNNAADLLSRLQVQQFKVQFPGMDKDCTKIPPASLHL